MLVSGSNSVWVSRSMSDRCTSVRQRTALLDAMFAAISPGLREARQCDGAWLPS